ncbi:MAG: ATP synthase F0 subunit C, partial [Anaerolineae bacterium]|nr:ATP synthase F0 subunit C [Anaerolineae bacterium]
MEAISTTTLTMIAIIVWGIGIIASTMTVAIVEGRAVLKALEGITRQPEAANRLQTAMIIGMALLETSAIYVILVITLLMGRFFPG